MRRSTFKRPKMVLIFNGAQVLVAVTRSLHSAAELTKGNLQAISFCCTGKYVCSGGLYFRHLHPDVEIELADLGTLMLKDYDALCGEKRTYYPVRKMAHKRALLENKRKSDNQKKGKYSINSLVYWVTYVHNVVYSFYRSMIYCYINSTQRCAGSIVIDIIPTNGADKRKFFPFAPYFPVTNVIKRYFYPYFPAIIGIKGYSFPYFPYLSGIMKIKTALYSLFSRLDWHKTVVFPCLGEIYEGIRSLSWEIPVT